MKYIWKMPLASHSQQAVCFPITLKNEIYNLMWNHMKLIFLYLWIFLFMYFQEVKLGDNRIKVFDKIKESMSFQLSHIKMFLFKYLLIFNMFYLQHQHHTITCKWSKVFRLKDWECYFWTPILSHIYRKISG